MCDKSPRSFFYVAEQTHLKYFRTDPPRKPAPTESFQVPVAAWSIFYTAPNKVDILKEFRQTLRWKIGLTKWVS